MFGPIVIAGTDTGIGKTVFAAALTGALDAAYWKPVQAGLEGETDSQSVLRLSGVAARNILPEVYKLNTPASPHIAAALDGIEIDVDRLAPPRTSSPFVIEMAGGLMVPLTRRVLQIDLLQRWKLPVVLVSSTRLGTINHSLLSIEALKTRAIPLLGIAFTGEAADAPMRTIGDLGGVKILGRLPHIEPLDAANLRAAFKENFDVRQILGIGEGGP
jgi:dethiobiotin synthetase